MGLNTILPIFSELFGACKGRADNSDMGLDIDTSPVQPHFSRGPRVIQAAATSTRQSSTRQSADQHHRIGARRKVRVPGRLTWRDSTGTLRFVSVVTCDVSDLDAFVECQVPASIPLYRLVHFQVERGARECTELPAALRSGKVLSAVYRVGAYRAATGTPHGYALRLLVEPSRAAAAQTMALAN
jgi:hypothetical protein